MRKKSFLKKIIVLALAVCLAVQAAAVPAAASTNVSKEKVNIQADKIISAAVNESDSKKVKLKKLFQYAEDNWGYFRTGIPGNSSNWYRSYAFDTYIREKGSCYSYAAAYGYLARRATGYKVRIGIGETNGFGNGLQKHAWTEVQIKSTWYICDTNLDQNAAGKSLKYYLKKRNSSKMKKTYNKYKSVKYTTVK